MKTYFVDSFTNQKFKGNPAAVYIAESYASLAEMLTMSSGASFSSSSGLKKLY